jgi:signal recognition particle receptor subunit beta
VNEYKLLFTGSAGAGKTTAIAAISEISPVSTDVKNSDAALAKEKTTAAMDYGEVSLDGGDVLRLYATPGQERFAFMWEILARGALGLVILIDNSRPDPLGDLTLYAGNFAGLIKDRACVVGVGRTHTHPAPAIKAFVDQLGAMGLPCPVVPVDVREASQVLVLVDLLLTQLERSPC